MKNLLTIFGVLVVAQLGQASCIYTEHRILSSEVVPRGLCRLDQAPVLYETSQHYHKMGRRQVWAWKATVTEKVQIKEKILVYLMDQCLGQVLSRDTETRVRVEQITHKIKNPNLDPHLNESYKLLPMTLEEATKAQLELLKDCRKGNL